jgi:hypothetical protein
MSCRDLRVRCACVDAWLWVEAFPSNHRVVGSCVPVLLRSGSLMPDVPETGDWLVDPSLPRMTKLHSLKSSNVPSTTHLYRYTPVLLPR